MLARVVCVSLLAAAASCRQEYPRFEGAAESMGPPARHAVREERLRAIMADLTSLAVQRLPQEMDRAALRERRSRELARSAEALAADATAIPAAIEGVRMADEDRRLFHEYARRLRVEAEAFALLAEEARQESLDAKWADIISTCNACHSSFRVLPVVGTGP
jgi:cytochrome c556